MVSQYSRNYPYVSIPGKCSEQHLNELLQSNQQGYVLKGRTTMKKACPLVLVLPRTYHHRLDGALKH